MLLEQFRQAKMGEISALRTLEKQGISPEPLLYDRPDFRMALAIPPQGAALHVVAEYKCASPSRGVITQAFSPEDIALQYARGGASCISVLTEELFFKGDIDFLERMTEVNLPLLRKDFIFDPLQVQATAATPASALLLIVRMTPDACFLKDLREQTEALGMHAVVEVFNQADLDLARQSGAKIIQVNARDLDTLVTDRQICLDIIKEKDSQEVWIAASAMEKPEHLKAAAKAGYNAALIGSSLMSHASPANYLAHLRYESQN